MTMLTVKQSLAILGEHHIISSEQMIRRWLRTGKIKGIPPESRKTGWRISDRELFRFMDQLRWEGSAYEEGIDDKTKIKRMEKEIMNLENKIENLHKKNMELELQLGIDPF